MVFHVDPYLTNPRSDDASIAGDMAIFACVGVRRQLFALLALPSLHRTIFALSGLAQGLRGMRLAPSV
jgi:hypothetical protein